MSPCISHDCPLDDRSVHSHQLGEKSQCCTTCLLFREVVKALSDSEGNEQLAPTYYADTKCGFQVH